VVGVDAVRPLLERLDRPERTLVHADITRGLPGALGKFDSALLLDVIEHLDDEVAVLRAVADYVEPNGILVVSVPARQDLYSAFDAVQGHRRRYSAESLLAVLTRAEWTPERLMWWGGWMVPIFRLRQRRPQQSDLAPHLQYRSFLKLPPRPFRWALELAFRLDHFATLGGLNPTGTSLIAVARKRVSCPT
jgi:SAM-dependent methyltransferase